MNIEKLMEINVDNLIGKQHEGLKRYAVDKLKTIAELIHTEQYDKADKLLSYSPAGDGYGLDNHYINFNYDKYDRDISEVLSELENLKLKMEKSKL